MSKRAFDSDRYRYDQGDRRVQSGARSQSQRPEDVEARINRAAFQRTVRKGLMLFPLATIICIAALMVVYYVFAILNTAHLEGPAPGFWDAVVPNIGWILLIGFISGIVWAVSYFIRGGVAVSREWSMIWQHFFPWRGRDRNLRNKP